MANKDGRKQQRKSPSDLSPASEKMREPIGIRLDDIEAIKNDLRQRITDHPRGMTSASRWSMYADVGELYGASPLQVMRIADHTNNDRINPKHYTIKASRQDRVMWGVVADKLGTTIKDAANFGLHAACERLGLDLHDLDAEEGGAMT